MPIKIPNDLPAKAVLNSEQVFVMTDERAVHQDIRPLNLLFLNLMPKKINTEIQYMRKLSNTPLQVNITLLKVDEHVSKNTPQEHLNTFYKSFEEISDKFFDGMIITGAPLDRMEFHNVTYWKALKKIILWSSTHKQYLSTTVDEITRGFDDSFNAPISRYCDFPVDLIKEKTDLDVLASSSVTGLYLAVSKDHRQVYVSGHPEYDADTIAQEYFRDLSAGINPEIPENYFPDNDPEKIPSASWRAHASLLFGNWLNYYVYQATPYDFVNR